MKVIKLHKHTHIHTHTDMHRHAHTHAHAHVHTLTYSSTHFLHTVMSKTLSDIMNLN